MSEGFRRRRAGVGFFFPIRVSKPSRSESGIFVATIMRKFLHVARTYSPFSVTSMCLMPAPSPGIFVLARMVLLYNLMEPSSDPIAHWPAPVVHMDVNFGLV